MTVPAQFGSYQIIREIGRGGMGVVYLAKDPAVNRQLALKVLPADLATDELSRRRFEQEVAVFARLEHPHIVPTYAVDLDGASPLLVMRYLAGGTLRDRMQGGRYARPELWRAMNQVARALDYAHNEGLVHRDVKPTNILFDDTGNAYVSDFGIAKIINATSMLTMANSMTGTPAYMSPEQFRQETVDGRSDQYSLAVVLFEALTGRPPFSGDTLQLMYQHVYERPPSIHSLVENLPAGLSAVFERALAKRPEQRYPSVEAFISDAQRQSTAPAPPKTDPAPADHSTPPAPDRRESSGGRHRPPIVSGAGGGSGAERPKAAPPPPRGKKPVIVSGAGGAMAVARGRRSLLIGLAVVGVLAVLLYLLLASGGDEPATAGPDTSTATVVATPAEGNGTPDGGNASSGAPATNESPGEQPTVIVGGVETPADWRLVGGGSPVLVRSREESMQVRFAGGEALYLAPESIILLALIGEEGRDVLEVEVRNGRMVAATGAGDAPAGRPIRITNPFGASAQLEAGLMGIHGSLEPLRFAVDCLMGDGCELAGDLDDTVLALAAGEGGRVGSSGRPEATGRARFEMYTPLSELVPTPTATPVPTNTPVPTATSTSTPTRALPPTAAITATLAAAPTTSSTSPPPQDAPPPRPTATEAPILPTATLEPTAYSED
jgi:serine/threonine-protein kinase